ncbi:MAG: Asp-tRNA(Asn)/Glu-tRNA(Gln) amidotransferase subunit GatC [Legionella sp.]|nr:Asp-tRNA(Asn)/Glu-tRNA(Gln) amidotransferase subunit GatC [Legionella sp.]
MTLSITDVRAIAALAYLEADNDDMEKLAREVNDIMDFVQQLNQVNTTQVAPLFHPMDLHQPRRSDEVSEESCLRELAEIAPHFEEQLYLVPKVIDAGK